MPMPSEHGQTFAKFHAVSKADVNEAIETALKAKQAWETTPFVDRAAIFLRAAELVSTKYRYELMTATMFGQGKNAWQAEIDAAAETADFYRFNVSLAQEIYSKQPSLHTPGEFGRTDWRPLEGFVYSVSPFNFTAIGANLISVPALMGNVVVRKPSPMAVYPSYLVHQILLEAGLPPGVIQPVNGDAELITSTVLDHREFSALNFIGSSKVFKSLYDKIAEGVAKDKYREFPRMVVETSGKNFHLLHPSADIEKAARHTVRAAFEYSGKKCSACSRIYVPESRADEFFAAMNRELEVVKMGPPEYFQNFIGPVIDRNAFSKSTQAIDEANQDDAVELITGGKYDGSKGFYIEPTIYRTKVEDHKLLNEELFGPVLAASVHPDHHFDSVLDRVDRQGGGFALTGAIFAQDPLAIRKAEDRLRYAAGNFYTNCKTTGAVIGQQSFGGSRASGTCNKAGSTNLFMRFTASRTLKEDYTKLGSVLYPSNA